LSSRGRNSTLEGISYAFEATAEFIRNSNKGLLIGAIIVLLVTIYTILNAYSTLSKTFSLT